jgi:hypothetical protein
MRIAFAKGTTAFLPSLMTKFPKLARCWRTFFRVSSPSPSHVGCVRATSSRRCGSANEAPRYFRLPLRWRWRLYRLQQPSRAASVNASGVEAPSLAAERILRAICRRIMSSGSRPVRRRTFTAASCAVAILPSAGVSKNSTGCRLNYAGLKRKAQSREMALEGAFLRLRPFPYNCLSSLLRTVWSEDRNVRTGSELSGKQSIRRTVMNSRVQTGRSPATTRPAAGAPDLRPGKTAKSGSGESADSSPT